jgi:hypothetical protein
LCRGLVIVAVVHLFWVYGICCVGIGRVACGMMCGGGFWVRGKNVVSFFSFSCGVVVFVHLDNRIL